MSLKFENKESLQRYCTYVELIGDFAREIKKGGDGYTLQMLILMQYSDLKEEVDESYIPDVIHTLGQKANNVIMEISKFNCNHQLNISHFSIPLCGYMEVLHETM